MAIERQKLSGAFSAGAGTGKVPNRGEGLGSVLGPKAVPAKRPAPEVKATPAAESPKPTTMRTPKASSTRTRKRSAPVYLSDVDYDKLRHYAAEHSMSYADVVVSAFRELHSQIDSLFADTPAADDGDGDLMPMAPATTTAPTGDNFVHLRLTDAQKHWLEKEQQRVGAPSRTRLVATVLHAYLA